MDERFDVKLSCVLVAFLLMACMGPFACVASTGHETAESLARHIETADGETDIWEYEESFARIQQVSIRFQKRDAISTGLDWTNHLVFGGTLPHRNDAGEISTNREPFPSINLVFPAQALHQIENEKIVREMRSPIQAGYRLTGVWVRLPAEPRAGPFIASSFTPVFNCGCGAGGGRWFHSLVAVIMLVLLVIAFILSLRNRVTGALWFVFAAVCLVLYLSGYAIEASAYTARAIFRGEESCHSLPGTLYTLLNDLLRIWAAAGLAVLPTLLAWLFKTRGHRFAILLGCVLILLLTLAKLTLVRWVLYGERMMPVFQSFIANAGQS